MSVSVLRALLLTAVPGSQLKEAKPSGHCAARRKPAQKPSGYG